MAGAWRGSATGSSTGFRRAAAPPVFVSQSFHAYADATLSGRSASDCAQYADRPVAGRLDVTGAALLRDREIGPTSGRNQPPYLAWSTAASRRRALTGVLIAAKLRLIAEVIVIQAAAPKWRATSLRIWHKPSQANRCSGPSSLRPLDASSSRANSWCGEADGNILAKSAKRPDTPAAAIA